MDIVSEAMTELILTYDSLYGQGSFLKMAKEGMNKQFRNERILNETMQKLKGEKRRFPYG